MADTWHSAKTPRPDCLHCEESMSGEHYLCTEKHPCGDCIDDALNAVYAVYVDNGDDDGPGERDTDLEHPWNMNA